MQLTNKKTHAPTKADVYIGRPSPLGNPFVIGKDGDRTAVIEKYRQWLWERIKANDEAVLAALRALNDDSVLVCWCAPLPCHGDIVIRAAAWLKQQK